MRIPATIASTPKAIDTVEEIGTLSSGSSPVRINHRPSRTTPIFLPDRPFVIEPHFAMIGAESSKSTLLRGSGMWIGVWTTFPYLFVPSSNVPAVLIETRTT